MAYQNLPLTPTTELEAVNYLLISIGEEPINDFEIGEGVSEVVIARTLVHQTNRQVQSQGFSFNSEQKYPLTRDVDNYIQLPSTTLKVDASDTSKNVVRRGNKLYNKDEFSYEFDETLEVNITFFLGFEEIPQTVRDYIVVRAARLFQSKVLGSQTLYEFTAQDEAQALANMMSDEMEVQDLNVLQNNSINFNLRRGF